MPQPVGQSTITIVFPHPHLARYKKACVCHFESTTTHSSLDRGEQYQDVPTPSSGKIQLLFMLKLFNYYVMLLMRRLLWSWSCWPWLLLPLKTMSSFVSVANSGSEVTVMVRNQRVERFCKNWNLICELQAAHTASVLTASVLTATVLTGRASIARITATAMAPSGVKRIYTANGYFQLECIVVMSIWNTCYVLLQSQIRFSWNRLLRLNLRYLFFRYTVIRGFFFKLLNVSINFGEITKFHCHFVFTLS